MQQNKESGGECSHVLTEEGQHMNSVIIKSLSFNNVKSVIITKLKLVVGTQDAK